MLFIGYIQGRCGNCSLQYCIFSSIFFFFLLVFPENVYADGIGVEDPPGLVAISIGTWSGSGDVDFDGNPFCVGSFTGDSCSAEADNYRVRLTNGTPGSSGQFRILDGTNSLPISIVYTDLANGSPDTLTEGMWTTSAKNGSDSCDSDNAQFTVLISELDLLAVPAGDYSETMFILFEQIENGSETYSDTVDIALTIPDLVQVSGLNDINLGTWDGIGNQSNSEDICVYRNSSGSYAITFTGSGGGNAFVLTNVGVDLAYSVTYFDGSTTVSASTGIALTGRTGHNQSSTICSGGTNATIAVSILENIIRSAPPAVYSGTLTMLVSPE